MTEETMTRIKDLVDGSKSHVETIVTDEPVDYASRKENRSELKNEPCEVIKIKAVDDKYLPKKIKIGDWIDLRAHGDCTLKAGEQKFIMLGVSMELPEGYEGIVAPRSSTFKNFGVLQTNAPGIIDRSFCGDSDEWGFSALAMRDTEIHDGDRICQFRIQRNQPKIEFVQVEHLGNPSRGGWGSTGVK